MLYPLSYGGLPEHQAYQVYRNDLWTLACEPPMWCFGWQYERCAPPAAQSARIDVMSLRPNWLTPGSDADSPSIWPATANRLGGVLAVGGVTAPQLAADFGTPLYLLDEADFRARAVAFQKAFAPWRVYYAGKAFLCKTVARWAAECGLGVDVCSLGELTTALRAGVAPGVIGLHGNNKSEEELATAIEAGVGRIVVDADDEIDRLAGVLAGLGPQAGPVPVLVRVTPDVQAHTHAHTQTAVADQKFGFALAGGVALAALLRLRQMPGVELRGVHCHIGSQILDVEGYELAVSRLVGLLADYRDAAGEQLPECDLGGGFGIAYTPADEPLGPDVLARRMRAAMAAACASAGLAEPDCSIEPGRAIVGPAGVALYTVGVVKPVSLPDGIRTYVAVDGGLSDNPRPALYQAEYTAVLANRSSSAPPILCRVVGKHCETGDILVPHVYLPADVAPGDIIAVPASGAYQRAMASNYNGSARPPVVSVHDGAASVLVRRETLDDLLMLDVGR